MANDSVHWRKNCALWKRRSRIGIVMKGSMPSFIRSTKLLACESICARPRINREASTTYVPVICSEQTGKCSSPLAAFSMIVCA